MTSSDEMYERGVEDATQNDLNPFYYQHYYYYRRGYDEARRYMRRNQHNRGVPTRYVWGFLVGVVVVVLALVGAGLAFLPVQSANNVNAENTASVERMPTVAESVIPDIQPPTLAPLPVASPTPEGLYVGRSARVTNVGIAALLARSEPGTQYPVQARFSEDMQVTIVDGPVVADDYTWWRVEGEHGSGWSAERSQQGNLWLVPE